MWAHARQIHTHDAGVTPRAGAGWCQRAMARARAVVRAGRRSQEREGPAAATSLGGRWPKSTAAPAKGCLPRRRWWMRGECGRWRSRFDCRSKAGCVRAGCPCAPHLSLPRKSSLSEKISQTRAEEEGARVVRRHGWRRRRRRGRRKRRQRQKWRRRRWRRRGWQSGWTPPASPTLFLYAFLFQKKSTYSESNLGKFDANFHSRATIVFWMRSCPHAPACAPSGKEHVGNNT